MMALGPGDDDPGSLAGVAGAVRGPLGPGADDPQSPAGVAGAVVGPLGPGDLDGVDPHEGFLFLTPPAPGPGDTAMARSVVRFPKG